MSERCAVVTGGAQNIGRAIAERLRDDGYRVVVLDVIEPEVELFRADARRVDLSDRAAAEKAFAEIAADYPVTALINNVGVVAPAPSTMSMSPTLIASCTSTRAPPFWRQRPLFRQCGDWAADEL